MSGLDREFQDYFGAIDRAGGEDRCFLCRRTPSEVKAFFGFGEDGVPLEAAKHGLEDVDFNASDIMSYQGARPVCAVCQLNLDAACALGEQGAYLELLRQMEAERDHLWPPIGPPSASKSDSADESGADDRSDPGADDAGWGDGV
ncbi:MAG: hypothetical protein QF724_05065 [Planctomycetota bacterium]|jgi:hypothetical protein|nr:hypothetical protein [Planctomycetota bacterium]MDP6838289.1 hypothetical protein [Planctomycetota bacterium]MDP6955886.1 hypothetical protein [Planctomycetota bacterium]